MNDNIDPGILGLNLFAEPEPESDPFLLVFIIRLRGYNFIPDKKIPRYNFNQ